ncbi:hypothetical protein AB0451_39500 [Streptomyces sp. NPDC052000]|uniref:hypothetical protein n=1 Tax=Streptomyces sp. NPDC052000 TaxID=3155676 RepID=UPI00344CF348
MSELRESIFFATGILGVSQLLVLVVVLLSVHAVSVAGQQVHEYGDMNLVAAMDHFVAVLVVAANARLRGPVPGGVGGFFEGPPVGQFGQVGAEKGVGHKSLGSRSHMVTMGVPVFPVFQ